jgi:Glycosyl transferase family 90
MQSVFKKLEWKHRNNKFLYYAKGTLRDLIPAFFFRSKLQRELKKIKNFEREYILDRVNYYNKVSETHELSNDSIVLSDFKLTKKHSTYYFDSYEYTRYFSKLFRVKFVFGDVLSVPDQPTILKYRPIAAENNHYVLLKLNKVRLFNFSSDSRTYESKKNMLIGRAVVKLPARIQFYEKYFNHPMCDLGQINKEKNKHWVKEKLTIDEHLNYKFILCIEGYDIASNLRWVMSSNSLAVMPKPTFESWYMEGRLIPNHHYVLIKDDFSDLEERLNYYIENTNEALQIIKNANEYAQQFRNKRREDLISLLVLEKYFYRTGQHSPVDSSLYC